MKSGIYRILNKVNLKSYIGSACDLANRKRNHFSQLKSNKHYNSHLQSAFNLYGELNFIFEVIEYCTLKDLIVREQYFIDTLHPEYNICPIAGSRLNSVTPEAVKDKIRNSVREAYKSQDIRKKCGRSKEKHHQFNKPMSEETKSKISKSLKGRGPSKDHMEMLRKKALGRECPEHLRELIGERFRGQKFSEEHRDKLVKNHWTNRPDADEIRKRMSEAQKKRWESTDDN